MMLLDNLNYSEEEVNLYNPAFIGFVLYTAIREFLKFKPAGINYSLPFLIIPFSMTPSIGSVIPSNYKKPISTWMVANEGTLSDLPIVSEAHIPIVQSAISFLLDRDLISINNEGLIVLTKQKLALNPQLFKNNALIVDIKKTSERVGKWFSHAPSTELVFIQLGLRI